jgi:transcriptional regulator with XRE-family HTH domain
VPNKSTDYSPTPFGALLSQKRREARKSIRRLATEIGISHVGLGDVERGKRLTLGRAYWPRLVGVLPNLTMDELEAAAERSSSRELRPWEYEGQKRELAARMSQTVDAMNSDRLKADELDELIALLTRIGEQE